MEDGKEFLGIRLNGMHVFCEAVKDLGFLRRSKFSKLRDKEEGEEFLAALIHGINYT